MATRSRRCLESMVRLVCGLLSVVCGLFTCSASAQLTVSFTQESSPPGLFTSTSSQVATGTTVTTMTAPSPVSGYTFAYWTLNGVRHQDPLGQCPNPARFTVTKQMTALAHYVPSNEDSDADGIPDWFEWQSCGSLSRTATSDTDADGFSLSAENDRDQNPVIADQLVQGGISRRSSILLTFFLPPYLQYREISVPVGFWDRQLAIPSNTVRVLPDVSANGSAFGYMFGEWQTNGVRVADALNRSLGSLPILVSTDTLATAVFLPTNQSSGGDGLPDWYKLQFAGATNASAVTDTDADGYTLADEYNRDQSPALRDDLVEGGISRRSSVLVAFYNPNFAQYREVSAPVGFVDRTLIVPTNTVMILPDVSTNATSLGYQFAEWEINGVRIADALNRSIGGLSTMITTDTVATAVFYPSTQSSAGDGVPDWFKQQLLGNTNAAAQADADSDGFALLEEYNRDQNPALKDGLIGGGISRRSSVLVAIDTRPYYYYWIESSPPGLVLLSGQTLAGTNIVTPNALILGEPTYKFGYWLVNGAPQLDGHGMALTQTSFTVYANTVVTAFFFEPSADSNNDGMPDWWEGYYFGGATAADPLADNSGTGMNNLQKYLAGLHPKDSSSRLAITSFRRASDGYELGFPSVSGKVYQVEFNAALTLTNGWDLLLDNIQGDGTTIKIVDPTAGGETQRFYRVRLKQ